MSDSRYRQDPPWQVAARAEAQEIANLMYQYAIQNLPEYVRDAVMCRVQGIGQRQIAEREGVAATTIRSRLNVAKAILSGVDNAEG